VTKRDTITRDHRARLVSLNREFFAHYKHISYFFDKYFLSLYVYTRGLLGCLLGFWPLGKNPAGAITREIIVSFTGSFYCEFRRLVNLLLHPWGDGTPLYGLYRYVRPQRLWFFSRFGHKLGIDFSHFAVILTINRVSIFAIWFFF